MEKVIYEKLSQMDRIEYETKNSNFNIYFALCMAVSVILVTAALLVEKHKVFLYCSSVLFWLFGAVLNHRISAKLNTEFTEKALAKK